MTGALHHGGDQGDRRAPRGVRHPTARGSSDGGSGSLASPGRRGPPVGRRPHWQVAAPPESRLRTTVTVFFGLASLLCHRSRSLVTYTSPAASCSISAPRRASTGVSATPPAPRSACVIRTRRPHRRS